MATYYRWEKWTYTYTEHEATADYYELPVSSGPYAFGGHTKTVSEGSYDISGWTMHNVVTNGAFEQDGTINNPGYVAIARNGSSKVTTIYTCGMDNATNQDIIAFVTGDESTIRVSHNASRSSTKRITLSISASEQQGFAYSTSSAAYPNGGVDGDYYYDQRTTVTSPTASPSITYPATITTPSVTVSWTAASSNTSYPVSAYELSYSIDGGRSWIIYTNQTATSKPVIIPIGATSIMFRVRARDSNNQWGAYTTGTVSQVVLAPTLTVPMMVMQGQPCTVSWSEVEGADSYILQRKSSADADWTQVYAGADTEYTETVGTWTSLQYRVCAVFGSTNGPWVTSGAIQVVAASTLVISGSDGDLGTLTSDVSYSVSSDQTAPVIDVTVKVNGGEYTSFQAVSGQMYKVGVLDLPTGTGSIVITATTEVNEAPVTVTRTWTYTKADQSFPAAGSVARLTQGGQNVFPLTLAESVKAIGGPWGGNLSTALDKLAKAAVFNREAVPKYTEVKVDLSQITTQDAKDGKIIMLPYQGRMVPHIVVQVGNPDPEMYDASCDGVWLLRKDIGEKGQWNSSGVNTLAGSTIMTTMQGYVDDYDPAVQAAIKTVKIPYCVINDAEHTVMTLSNGYECKIFPLSAYEAGCQEQEPSSGYEYSVDGTKLSYFLEGDTSEANNKRIALLNNTASTWYFRSFAVFSARPADSKILSILQNGAFAAYFVTEPQGYRPCFTLPTTFQATYYVDQNGTVHAEQEYTQAGDFADLWGNIIPTVKIETGSYTGTGTYGSSNPNTLTFQKRPLLVFIGGNSNQNRLILINGPYGSAEENAFLNRGVVLNPANPAIYSAQVNCPENVLKWYSTNDSNQLNVSGYEYQYTAFYIG